MNFTKPQQWIRAAAMPSLMYLWSSRKWLRLQLKRYSFNIWVSVCVTNLLADISFVWKIPALLRLRSANIRWESLEHSLLSVVHSGSTMTSGNRVCLEQLPLADLSWGYIQLVTSALVYFFACLIFGVFLCNSFHLGRYFVLVLITWLWKVRCT